MCSSLSAPNACGWKIELPAHDNDDVNDGGGVRCVRARACVCVCAFEVLAGGWVVCWSGSLMNVFVCGGSEFCTHRARVQCRGAERGGGGVRLADSAAKGARTPLCMFALCNMP